MNPQQATENYFLLMCKYGNVDVIQAMVLSCSSSSSQTITSTHLVISQQLMQQGCRVSLSHGHVMVAQKICQMANICPDLTSIPTHIAVEMAPYCNGTIYESMHMFSDGTIEALSSINITDAQVKRFWPNVLSYLSTIAVTGPQWLREWHIEILLEEYKKTHVRNIQYLVDTYGLTIEYI